MARGLVLELGTVMHEGGVADTTWTLHFYTYCVLSSKDRGGELLVRRLGSRRTRDKGWPLHLLLGFRLPCIAGYTKLNVASSPKYVALQQSRAHPTSNAARNYTVNCHIHTHLANDPGSHTGLALLQMGSKIAINFRWRVVSFPYHPGVP